MEVRSGTLEAVVAQVPLDRLAEVPDRSVVEEVVVVGRLVL